MYSMLEITKNFLKWQAKQDAPSTEEENRRLERLIHLQDLLPILAQATLAEKERKAEEPAGALTGFLTF